MALPVGVPDQSCFPDATELLRQLATGERSAVAIVRDHLTRLEADRGRLNAATHVFAEEAMAQAHSPRPGALSGLPISVKETLGIRGESITAGSRRMPPIFCETDSEVVRRLRAAGAIIIARSNVPELALAGETENLLYGRTKNPLNPDRTCGGSSGGEAALVASGASAAGVGSDLLGSIRIPGSFCGVVGFKPASASVPKSGTWPVLDGFLDTWLAVGPITRSVRDTRLLYDVIADSPLPPPGSPHGLRLVIPRPFRMQMRDACIAAAMVRVRSALEDAGLVPEEHGFDDVTQHFLNLPRLLGHDLYDMLRKLLVTREGERFSLAAETLRQWLGRPTIYAGLHRLLTVIPLVRARRERTVYRIVDTYRAARAKYQELLGRDGVLLLPTLGFLAPEHGRMNRQTLKPGVNDALTPTTFCNYMDLPSITLPSWSDRDRATGLVPGVMLASAPGSEAQLLDAAEAVEPTLRGTPSQLPPSTQAAAPDSFTP